MLNRFRTVSRPDEADLVAARKALEPLRAVIEALNRMVTCGHCGRQVSSYHQHCPYCHEPNTNRS